MKCDVGDWVSFTVNGTVTIGQVLYRQPLSSWEGRAVGEHGLITTVGHVQESRVHERRPVCVEAAAAGRDS